MMARSAGAKEPASSAVIEDIPELHYETATIGILGQSPMIHNRVALKARMELLMPRGPLTGAQKAINLKHDPLQEYRDSVNRRRAHEKGPTRIIFPSPSFKGAMATAALDIPSVTKARVNRLTWVVGTSVDIYGVPEMIMSVVRNSDPGRTADIRTRAIMPKWGSLVHIRYILPLVKSQVVTRLLGAAGLIVGIGDYRQEKGKGNHGQFLVCSEDDERLLEIMATGGMAAQDKALETPVCFDQDTEDLYTWFVEELPKRMTERGERQAQAEARKAAREAAAERKLAQQATVASTVTGRTKEAGARRTRRGNGRGNGPAA
jgi:hypothetical protein